MLDQAGNTLAMIAAALPPLLLLVGGSVDMGRAYATQSRLQQACDSGVLAARKMLGTNLSNPSESSEEIGAIGDRFFNSNFRDGIYGTEDSQFQMALEADYAISGLATVSVPTTLMSVFGHDAMELSANCTAQLNTGQTDIMFVLDSTTSMLQTNSGDTDSRIETLRAKLKSFYNQIETNKAPNSTVRYGFVPYASNVNVGHLLESDWMVDEWTYQSRVAKDSGIDNTVNVPANYTYTISGYTGAQNPIEEYVSDTCPADTVTTDRTDPVDVSLDPHEYYVDELKNGIDYYCTSTDGVFLVSGTEYVDYGRRWTYKHRDAYTYTYRVMHYDYLPITFDVSSTNGAAGDAPTNVGGTVSGNFWSYTYESTYSYDGCIEERDTYEIDDYNNVDFARALDLDIDMVPNSSDPSTQWRPIFSHVAYARAKIGANGGRYSPDPVYDTVQGYTRPATIGDISACPTPARKLEEMDAASFADYVDSLEMAGQTYHDLGMIWGGRLMSSTGLFADENVDRGSSQTARHLIFLTDGETEAYELAYGAYGVEPLDQRRWSEASGETLTEVVEKRFLVACDEVKKRNITVWVIGFGTTLNPTFQACASTGRVFEASDAAQLDYAFSTIARTVGDLRLTK